MQFQDNKGRIIFPTENGWSAFISFTQLVHEAQPFASHATPDETFGAFHQAFENMLTENLVPVTLNELAAFLPKSFTIALTSRNERVFAKLNGVSITDKSFFRLGHCWLSKFDQINFDGIPEDERQFKNEALSSIFEVFDSESTVIAAGCNSGTSGRVKAESQYQYELAISMLCVMLNLSFKGAFDYLWQVRLMDRPEDGLAPQRNFSIVSDGSSATESQLSISSRFAEQQFEIDAASLENWQDSLLLDAVNTVVTDTRYRKIELLGRLESALFYFRQAATQSTPEMQLSTLWICVETLLTGSRGDVLKIAMPGLLATTFSSVNAEYWPRGAKTARELKRTFTRYYDDRSRTLHQGRRGSVSTQDVQEFSLIVSCLIIGVANQAQRGMKTLDELSRAVQKYARELDEDKPSNTLITRIRSWFKKTVPRRN